MRWMGPLLFVTALLGCQDDSGSNGGAAGSAGMFVAGLGGFAGMGGMAAAGASGASGMAGVSGMGGTGDASGAGGASGMAGASGTGGTGGMAANCIASTAGAPQPTFTWFFDNVLPSCGGPVCHSGPAGGNLVFDTKDNAFAQLMMPGMAMNTGPSTSMMDCSDTGLTRVVPNDPDASLLYAKLRTDMDPPCGNRMPPGSTLCADVLEALRMWIARVAVAMLPGT